MLFASESVGDSEDEPQTALTRGIQVRTEQIQVAAGTEMRGQWVIGPGPQHPGKSTVGI